MQGPKLYIIEVVFSYLSTRGCKNFAKALGLLLLLAKCSFIIFAGEEY